MSAWSCPTLCHLWTVACQAPLSMKFSRQKYWSGLPFPTPEELPDPGIEPFSLAVSYSKNPPAMQETWVQSQSWEDPLEEGMATHSSILAWRIPIVRGAWQLQCMGSQRVGHD